MNTIENTKREVAAGEIRTFCAWCKQAEKVAGQWVACSTDQYLNDASHGICATCAIAMRAECKTRKVAA